MTSIAVADVVGAAGVIAALVAVDGWRRGRHLDRQDRQLKEIHLLVNSRLSNVTDELSQVTNELAEATERIAQLEGALRGVAQQSRLAALPATDPQEKGP